MANTKTKAVIKYKKITLSTRHLKMLKFLRKGWQIKEISKEMKLTPFTIGVELKVLRDKTNNYTNIQMVADLVEKGII